MSALLAEIGPVERRVLLQIIRTLTVKFAPSIPVDRKEEPSLE